MTWRILKSVRGPVGADTSDLQCSAEVHSVHPATISPEVISDHITHKLQHFNNHHEGRWVDLPGGHITVATVAHIHVRMWCHTGEWKRGLVWDNVKLENMNEPARERTQSGSEPSPTSNIGQQASHAVEAAVDTMVAACRLQ